MIKQKQIERAFEEWWSPSLGRDMEMLTFGHSGKPVLGLIGNKERYYDWENQEIVGELQWPLAEGFNQLYCIDSIDSECILNEKVDTDVRIRRYKQYMAYISEEVFPFISDQSGYNRITLTGFDTGALHALNLALHHPEKFEKLVLVNGVYDIRPFMDGFVDEQIERYNPVTFITNPVNSNRVNKLKELDIRIVASHTETEYYQAGKLSEGLKQKNVSHQLDFWVEEHQNKWQLWGQMLNKHIP